MSTAVDEKHSASSSSSANNVPAGKNPNAMTYDERRRAALREVDEAKFSCCVGFFTDAYDIFAINIAATMLGFVYGKGCPQPNQDLGVKLPLLSAHWVGQLLFGWLADVVGRKKMYGVELMISDHRRNVAQALSGSGPAVGIVGAIIVWRFIMGVRYGGDPLLLSHYCHEAYKSSIINGPADLHKIDYCWRILIGLVLFPAALPSTSAANDVSIVVTNAKYKHDPDAVIERVQAPKASWADFIIFICMGFGYDKMIHTQRRQEGFVFLYCFANFFQNFGPNTTTFIVPGEAFPTRYRSTAHGISAASGKLGAIIAQVDFALFMLTGLFATFLIPETKGRTLEDLSNESQDGFVSGGAGPLELRDGVVVDPRTDRPVGVVQPVQGANAQY
ncbi:Phosphate [Rhizoctonia solani]|uniref:Phosphate n=1 Tax=Rhizoctonia solani TaxID=456999 RepID=A0A8H7IAT2_9AGAM|nr:Phosphate [Rhizoctonia solani]